MNKIFLILIILILFYFSVMYANYEKKSYYCDYYTVENAYDRFEQGDINGAMSEVYRGKEAGKAEPHPWDMMQW